MKLPFIGGSAPSRSPAADAAERVNLYVEVIETKQDQTKSDANLFLAPGRHLLVDLSISGVVRGVWSGGGRLFVCVGTTIYELDSAGATVSSHVLGGSAGSNGKPVQMFGNGNQLGIVADGYFYVDNGTPPPLISAGPLQARFQISGVLTVAVAPGPPPVYTATWTGGDKFPTAIAGIYILIGGVPNYVISRTNSTTIVITDPTAGVGAGTCATGLAGMPTGGLTRYVYWQSGSVFNTAWEGLPITINGVAYVVDKVLGPYVLTLTTDVLSTATGVAFSVVQSNLIYSGAAGALVTAVTGGYLDGSAYVQRPSASSIAYTDLVIGATTTDVTSAAHPFDETQIGEILIITGGAGFTAGTYTVASVDYAHVATLNAVVGVAASVGGTGTGYPPDLGTQVNFSDVQDFTMWRGLNFKQKEGAPDYIRGILIDSEVLYPFGRETTEAWQNDPSTGTPSRIPGAMQKYGAISSWGMGAINSKVYFMGGDSQGNLIAYRIDGFTPTRISTSAEEAAWKAAGLGTDCISYTYMEDGHVFWVTNFGAQAWAWDETSKTWHKRMSWDGAAFAAYPTMFHTFVQEWGDKHITGGTGTGKVCISSSGFYDDLGADMAWRFTIPYRYNGGNQLFWGRMTLEAETGTVPSGAAPNVTRDYSDNRGQTFVNPQTADLGVHADYTKRVFWPNGGSSRGRAWRFFGSGQYKVALIDLECEETAGIV